MTRARARGGARLALAAGALALMAGPAWGYVRTRTTETNKEMWWPRADLSVVLYAGDPPPFMTQPEVVTAVQAAAATWSTPQISCTAVSLSVGPIDASEGPVGYDGTNRVTFRRSEWRKVPCDPAKEKSCAPYDARALAITSVFAQTKNGMILDADMELNGVYRKWGDVVTKRDAISQSGEEVHDLQNTVTHEFGHLVGLDHNCWDPAVTAAAPLDQTGAQVPRCNDAPAAVRAATMFNTARPMDTDKRDLSPDDIQAVCDVYPVGYAPDLGGDSGGCAVGGRRGAPGAGLLALGALGLAAALGRRRLSGGRRRR
jgi:hypothetical protein